MRSCERTRRTKGPEISLYATFVHSVTFSIHSTTFYKCRAYKVLQDLRLFAVQSGIMLQDMVDTRQWRM